MHTKKELEETLHRRFLWHEYADKGAYIAGSRFDGSDPIEVITHFDPDGKERCHVKCAGVPVMVPIERFSSGAQCAKCLDRATPSMYACSADSNSSAFYPYDLTADIDSDKPLSNRLAVPEGCPHATSDAMILDDEQREHKYWASSISGIQNSKRATPYSWKIVETKDKLTLSIQYRIRYLDGKSMDAVGSSMYCHISCNLGTGMTYMSDIHSDKGRWRNANRGNRMETLTFAKRFYLLFDMPGYTELKVPLSAFYDALVQKLAGMGFNCLELLSVPLGKRWDVEVMVPRTAFLNSEELLRSIAVLNRFPNLGRYVLPTDVRSIVSLYLRRRFDHLPREVSPSTLADAMSLPDTPFLRAAVERDPTNAVIAVMLDEWGFSAEDIDKLAIRGFDKVKKILERIVPLQNKHARNYEMFDMLSIAAPVCLLYGAKHHDPIASSFELALGGDAIEEIKDKMLQSMSKTLLRPFQKAGQRWLPSSQGLAFSFASDNGSHARIQLSSKEGPLVELVTAMTIYFDRRAWNKREARRFVQWLREIDSDPGSAKASALGERVREAMLRAMRFSPELTHVLSFSQDPYSERECRIVYEWAYKNGVEVSQRVDEPYDAAKSVRRSIARRLERKRKAKRDAKAEKQSA